MQPVLRHELSLHPTSCKHAHSRCMLVMAEEVCMAHTVLSCCTAIGMIRYLPSAARV